MDEKYRQIEEAFRLYKQGKVAAKPPEEGWFTAAEFAKKIGCSHYHANRVLGKMRKDNVVKVEKFSLKTANGGYYPVPHYKLTQPID